MPILKVRLIGEPPRSVRRNLAQSLADAAGRVLKTPPQHTWVTVKILAREDYAENQGADDDVAPVFVSVLKRDVSPARELKIEIKALAKAVAAVCRRPEENVHVIYEPPGRGRIAFGGKLVE